MREETTENAAPSDAPERDGRTPADEPSGRSRGLLVAFVVACAAVVPRLLTVGHHYNLDEWLWMTRSTRFSDALMGFDPAHMDATQPLSGTMPGIPTVWLGSLARLVWSIGSVLGLVDSGQLFSESASAYTTAQSMVALATAALIGLLVWVLSQWISTRVAVLAGALLATEPFWVSLGSIMHTDELVALFGLTGLVTLAWVLEVPAGVVGPRRPRRWAMAAAALLTASVLTKVSGVLYGAPALGMVLWAVIRAGGDHDGATVSVDARRRIIRLCGQMALSAVVVMVVLYPALVFDLPNQWNALRDQFTTVGNTRRIYYLGERTVDPGVSFYPVTLAYHSTVWFLLLAPVGLAVALARSATRRFAALAVAWSIVPGLGLLWSGLTYSRYGLVVLGPLTVAASCAVHPAATVAGRWANSADRLVAAGAAAMLLVAVWVAPWGSLTFNPVLSAYRAPIDTLQLGWNESQAAALPIIEADVRARGGTCASLLVSGLGMTPIPGPCVPQWTRYRDRADYVVIPTNLKQREPLVTWNLPKEFDRIGIGSIRGQRLAEVWRRVEPKPLDGS